MDVSAMLSDIDDHGFTDTSSERKMAMLNEAYWDVCGREPWPFLEATVNLTFDGTNPTPTNLPSDFHAVISMDTDDNWTMQHIDYDDWYSRYSSVTTATGKARMFYFVAGQLNVYPIPAASDVVKLYYIRTPAELQSTDLEAAIVIPKQYHRALLVNGAIYRLDAMEDDADIAYGFQQYYEAAIQRMREFMWRRQYQRPEVVRPVDPDDLGWQSAWTGWV